MQQKEKHNGIEIGTEETESFFAEGDYGYFHDWSADPEGQAALSQESLAGRSDLQRWLRGRRDLFEKLAENARHQRPRGLGNRAAEHRLA